MEYLESQASFTWLISTHCSLINMKKTNTLVKTIISILAAFLVTFIVVFCKNAFSKDIKGASVGVSAISQASKIDTLFIGASSFRKGLNMHLLEDNLEGQTYMLTYNGNQPMNMDIELQELYKAGTEINTLVLEFDPGMIDWHADLSDKRLLWDISLDSKVKIWNLLSQREDADFFMMYDYWVSSNIDYMFTYPISKPVISKRYYRGGNTGEDDVKGLSFEELEALPVREDPGFSDLQKSSLQDIISLCNANNTKLIVLESPNYKKMYEDENYANKCVILRQFFEDAMIPVYTKEDLDFDYTNPAYYSDLSHMSTEGMNIYTGKVVNLLTNVK